MVAGPVLYNVRRNKMNEIALALIIGICSSLLATGLFIAISELFRRVILPWYADKVYRGVRIDGHWEVEDVADYSNGERCQSMTLKQKGDVISGVYTHADPEDTDVYDLHGRVRDQYFMATAAPQSNRHIDGIVLMLKIFNQGGKQRLKGGVLYQDDASDSNVGVHMDITFTWIERHGGSQRRRSANKANKPQHPTA